MGVDNNDITIFTIALSPEKVNKHYRQKIAVVLYNIKVMEAHGKPGNGGNKLLYVVINFLH